MVAKVIVYDDTRDKAIKKMLRSLDELVIEGVPTNLEQQKEILQNKKFVSGNFGTSFYVEVYGDK
jgi:acetyl-CoA carboxylase biotin carboxylase subunit